MDMKLKARRSAIGSAFLATSMLLGCESALAVKASEESHRLVRPNDVVSSLGAATFGEEINHYSGSLSFRHTDISLPGNDDLPMSVGRRYTVEGTGAYGGGASKFGGGLFGDWDIDLPVIHGTFAASGAQGVRGFKVLVVQGGPVESAVGTGESGASDARCTKFGPPPDYKGLPLSSYVIFSYFDYWHGINLYVPGAGDQEILKRSSQNTSAPGGQVSSYPLVTQSHWQFSCLPTLANGEPGEGFLARSPSGMTYRFDWLVYRQADTLSKSDSSGGVTNLDGSNINPDPWTAHLARSQALLYPTRITDRFGNAVTLNWSGSKLLSMSASDGRQLTFSYGSGTTIQSISDGSRTWSYGYSNNLLTSMTLPDLSQWTFSLFSLQKSLQFISPPVCESPGMLTSTAETSGSITHPSGATATFTIKPVTQGLSWVAYSCSTISQKGPSATYPSLSVVRKQISGPGLPLLRWDYEHGPTNHCWTGPSAPAPVCTKNSVTTKNVKITAPDGGETRLYFSNRVGDKQGKLVKTEYLDGGSIVRTDVTTYGSPAGKAFPDPVGISITDRGDTDESQRIYPSEALASTVNGRLVTHATSVWDQFGNPTSVSKSDGVTSKSELITYDNNTSLWVLGQTSSVKNVGSTTFETEVVYDAATGLPVERKSFGRTEATFGYCTAVSATCAAKGLMSWSRDGAGAQTSYQNHHRGIPQKVIFADDRFVTGTVSDRGWVTSYTDEMGRETAYDYDLMGRLKRIDYPRDIQSWDTTFVNFSKQDSAEYGVAGGHWKQSITTGRYRKETVYDALWRPVLTHEWDAQSGGNDRYTVRATRGLVHIGVWLFALAMAYPYLPGSDTEAFKGITVLLGVMISLGSSNFVGQAMSGLILTYSRTLHVGEYVRIAEVEGTVTEMGTFATRIRTGLGEELTLPNTLIVGAVTKNYSRTVKDKGYIVDTVLTIGYDTPWRQVHAMMIEAARRTEGILPTPAPHVFQTALSDFYVEYRLVAQAVASAPRPRAQVLTDLHTHLQDVFNENGVQIMSPHYLGDPAEAKVVPRSRWFAPPAKGR